MPKIDKFIIPGGHEKVSYCHIARSVCRRAERNASKLKSIYSKTSDVLETGVATSLLIWKIISNYLDVGSLSIAS